MTEKEEAPFAGAKYEFHCAINGSEVLTFRAFDYPKDGVCVGFDITGASGEFRSVLIAEKDVPELSGALLSCLSAALRAKEDKAVAERTELYESLIYGRTKEALRPGTVDAVKP